MDHTPFIIASYAVFALVLLWTGLSPFFWRHQVIKALRQRRRLLPEHNPTEKPS